MLAPISVALAVASTAFAGSLIPRATAAGRNCGTSISQEKLLSAEKHFSANKVASKVSASHKAAPIQVCSLQSDHLFLVLPFHCRSTGT